MLPFSGRVSFHVNGVNTAIGDGFPESSIDQLLLLHRPETFELRADDNQMNVIAFEPYLGVAPGYVASQKGLNFFNLHERASFSTELEISPVVYLRSTHHTTLYPWS